MKPCLIVVDGIQAAHIIYDENPNDMLAVLGAKHELREQIFTKTMTIQVWKPDNERPGRHFVYTGRYVMFFAELLAKTTDKENMENLARRIRRKTGDFADHTRIWIEFSVAYLNVRYTVHSDTSSILIASSYYETWSLSLEATRTSSSSPSTPKILASMLLDWKHGF